MYISRFLRINVPLLSNKRKSFAELETYQRTNIKFYISILVCNTQWSYTYLLLLLKKMFIVNKNYINWTLISRKLLL